MRISDWSSDVCSSDLPGYIRGWENLDSYEFNLGSTYVMGATDTFNFIKADQIITLFEFGATWVPGLPSLDRLQLEAPGTFTQASAGAEGSGDAEIGRAPCRVRGGQKV